MAFTKHTYLFIIILIGTYFCGYAQQESAGDAVISYLPTKNQTRSESELTVDERMVCAWDGAEIRLTPGEKAPSAGVLPFGEEVQLLGRRATVISENRRNYLEVKVTGTNAIGWIKENLLLDGGLVVVLRTTPFYPSYKSLYMANDGDIFEAGELAILTNFEEDGEYIQLVGRNKGPNGLKKGWIKGLDRVSVRHNDLVVANRIYEIQKSKDAKFQRSSLNGIRGMAEFQQSGMELALEYAIQRTYIPGGLPVVSNTSNPTRSPNSKKAKTTSAKKGATTTAKKPEPKDKNFVVREVVDMETNLSYNRVTETGTIMEVNGPRRPKNIYWCYHKTRPIGSEILLHVPSGGIVKLEVVARLKSNNPNSIGLGKAVLEQVYGTRFHKEATFSYPQ